MGLYEVPLSMFLLGFGMGTMLANFHMCGIMFVLRAAFNTVCQNRCDSSTTCRLCRLENENCSHLIPSPDLGRQITTTSNTNICIQSITYQNGMRLSTICLNCWIN